MRVTRRVTARAAFNQHALDALAGNVRQLVLIGEGHLGVLRLRRSRENAAARQDSDKQQTADKGCVFMEVPILRLADAGSGSCL